MELLKKPKHKGHLFLPLVREHEILRPYVLRGRPLQLPSAASTEQRSVAQCVWAPLVPPGERSGAEGEGEGEGRAPGLCSPGGLGDGRAWAGAGAGAGWGGLGWALAGSGPSVNICCETQSHGQPWRWPAPASQTSSDPLTV